MEELSAVDGRRFPAHGWIGLGLAVIFWTLNWSLPGLRTHWGFFPMWLGYCLVIDALVFWRRGTSLLARDPLRYLGLFAASAPAWWLFEAINQRLHNWYYLGGEFLTPLQFNLWATLSFTTVIPAVFGSAELCSTLGFVRRLGGGPHIRPDRLTTGLFFAAGLVMLVAMWVWPRLFFPFLWIALYCLLEPLNVWLGFRSLSYYTKDGDWRPVISLWLGVLLTASFWEMWNFFSYPKWIYNVPWGNWLHIFEMPLLGYGGYLPFALELFALYHFLTGLLGDRNRKYVEFDSLPLES